jgi:hypothetical protein
VRSVVVILIICALIILAFSPSWFDNLMGGNRIVGSVDTPLAIHPRQRVAQPIAG